MSELISKEFQQLCNTQDFPSTSDFICLDTGSDEVGTGSNDSPFRSLQHALLSTIPSNSPVGNTTPREAVMVI